MTKTYELQPRFDSRKSFYKKALVIQDKEGLHLQSYNTRVARIDNAGELHINGTYSPTTLRHIKEFMYQNGFQVLSKNEIEEKYNC